MSVLRSPRYKSDPGYEYYQLSEHDIKQMWKDANRMGTKNHNQVGKLATMIGFHLLRLYARHDRIQQTTITTAT
jgi:hypothetical protein